jgi:hypothetical protein
MGKYYINSITECIFVKRKKLYGFDSGKEYKFLKMVFENMNAFNKAKNFWYTEYGKNEDGSNMNFYEDKSRKLLKKGLLFKNTYTQIYESNIPPLLRFFHIRDISLSGWVALPNKKTRTITDTYKTTTCEYEFSIDYKNIIPLNNKETRVPYKICSFDIEASSSHGDFPIPIKSYKKLVTQMIEYFENLTLEITPTFCKNIIQRIIHAAFGYEKMDTIDLVYPKKDVVPKNVDQLDLLIDKLLSTQVRNINKKTVENINTIEKLFANITDENDDEEEMKKMMKNK